MKERRRRKRMKRRELDRSMVKADHMSAQIKTKGVKKKKKRRRK
jgi:hypothetical protein